MSKRLIVNADDLGRSAGVDRGVFEAHQRGIVKSATVLINRSHAAAALTHAAAHAPDLGLGLHFNLTSGLPVASSGQISSLVDGDGRFYHISRWPTVSGRFDAGQIELEMRAQILRFIEFAGRPPDHLDSHHHATYLHPTVLRALLKLAAEYDVPIRNPLASRPPAQLLRDISALLPGLAPDRARDLLEQLTAAFETNAPLPRWPDRFVGDFYDGAATLDYLLTILTNLGEGVTEIMCHPGYAADLNSVYTRQREQELAVLTHPRVAEVVADEGIELITFADL